MINALLDGNAKFQSEEFEKNKAYYRTIAAKQTPTVIWIGCSDSRVNEHVITGAKPGTIFVHRNVANIVAFNDVNLCSILEFGLVHLKIEDIVVCGHTSCGGVKALDAGTLQANYIADWLCIARGAKIIADRIAAEKSLSPEERVELLTAENVKLQIRHLKELSLIKNMHKIGEVPRIHGWLYRVETGMIDVLEDGRGSSTSH
jgi:carbonic anhydrase